MRDSLSTYLRSALALVRMRIDASRTRNGNDEGCREIARLRLLEDMIKEQMPNENTRPPARASR
jgi:hypothetical protein